MTAHPIRRAVLPGVVAAVVLGLLAALIGVAGGWAEAGPVPGRPAAPGELVVLARWEVRVVSAELRDTDPEGGYETAETVAVRLELLNTSEATQPSPAYDLITVEGIDLEPAYDGFRPAGGNGSLSMDPGIAQPVDLVLVYPDEAEVTAPASVRVVLRDEVVDEGLAGAPAWGLGGRLAEVDVPLVDRRAGGR